MNYHRIDLSHLETPSFLQQSRHLQAYRNRNKLIITVLWNKKIYESIWGEKRNQRAFRESVTVPLLGGLSFSNFKAGKSRWL